MIARVARSSAGAEMGVMTDDQGTRLRELICKGGEGDQISFQLFFHRSFTLTLCEKKTETSFVEEVEEIKSASNFFSQILHLDSQLWHAIYLVLDRQ